MDINKTLFEMQDLGYRDFHSRLMPTISKELIIGIRIPQLRKFAKTLSKTKEGETFIKKLPHKYYEENNLHAFLIEEIKDFDKTLYETERFLPYIDNWATCDMFFPKVFEKHKEKILEKIYEWIDSEKEYTVRFAIGLMMKMFLDKDFKKEYLENIAKVHSDKYYINMMIAWFFATALAKQYNDTLSYLTEKRLELWVHNKTIQKAIESKRIDKNTKEYLKTLKR